MTSPKIALFFFQSGENATLSYQHGWPGALLASRLFDCVPFNLAQRTFADLMAVARQLLAGRFDAIVLLHSVFSNQQNLRGFLMWAVAACRVPKVFFIGNEYKHMPEKIRFCRRLGVDLLITQSNDERVYSLYQNALGCEVACVPNTGIDPNVFRPIIPLKLRQIDIGYRSYASTWYLGNDEKSAIADWFLANSPRLGVKVDVSLSSADRFDAPGYAGFLNRCRGQIGTEAGGDYFELTDRTRKLVNAYINQHPSATWPEIKSLFFDSYGPSIPMRIISGRQVEAAACKTVQILFEGRYNDYLSPDQHYIPLKKDFSNVGEAMEKLADADYCKRITDNAFEIAMAELTYDKLILRFGDALSRVL
jgi:hypothetical protein